MAQETLLTVSQAAARGFSVDDFARFWAQPNPALVPQAVTSDVVGHWPGADEPVRGVAAYAERIGQVLAVIPDLRLEVIEHATNGDLLFIHWRAHGTGAAGAFAMSGIDRIRLRDGRVAENVIVFDTQRFQDLIGRRLPYAQF